MSLRQDLFDGYAEVMFRRPGTVLVVVLLAVMALASGAAQVQTQQQNTEDLLPDSIPAIAAFDVIGTEFPSAGGTSYTVLIETDPRYPNSTEVRDVRDPRLIRFTARLASAYRSIDVVQEVTGPADLFSELPRTQQEVREVLDAVGPAQWSRTIGQDYRAVRMTVTSSGLSADERMALASRIEEVARTTEAPPGLQLSFTGQPFIDQAFQDQTNQTMSLTGLAALLGVILTVVILFRSVYYGFTSLLTLIVGVLAGFGLFGLLGYDMSPATSGAISMGIGIAIDFGIQPVARYREERERQDIRPAIETMIEGTITPMTVGLVAACIGFLALTAGVLTFLQDLGVLLTLMTVTAYLSAFLVVPPVMVLYDRYLTGEDATMHISILER